MHVRGLEQGYFGQPTCLCHTSMAPCVFNSQLYVWRMTLVILARFEEDSSDFRRFKQHRCDPAGWRTDRHIIILLAHPKFEKYNLSSLTRATCRWTDATSVAKSH